MGGNGRKGQEGQQWQGDHLTSQHICDPGLLILKVCLLTPVHFTPLPSPKIEQWTDMVFLGVAGIGHPLFHHVLGFMLGLGEEEVFLEYACDSGWHCKGPSDGRSKIR